ncbi:MAG: class I SAM-dependent methyltransferase [Bryobacteraceae bacterium]
MSTEFTGERVIPDLVDENLWNEHVSRYAFASRLSRNRRVLDAGCGVGYGSAELSYSANTVTAVDISPEAVAFARKQYPRRNLNCLVGSCTALPLADSSFDLVVAFEVIEHLADWQLLLAEAKRVLAPGGQFIVSTPNKTYYAESRNLSGPNPFHEHEFEYEEFRDALTAVFPHVSLFLQDHTEGLLFQAVGSRGSAEVRLEGKDPAPHDANFYIAVCAMSPQTGSPTFVYLPSAANVLRERGIHISRLEAELRTKDEWLAESRQQHQELVGLFRQQTADLERQNAWAAELDGKLVAAGQRIGQLQDEFAAEQKASAELAAAYAAKVADLENEVRARTQWAIDTEERLSAELAGKVAELAHCVDVLHETEATLETRTAWALQLDKERDALAAQLSMVQASRWLRLGRTLGIGPEIQKIRNQ